MIRQMRLLAMCAAIVGLAALALPGCGSSGEGDVNETDTETKAPLPRAFDNMLNLLPAANTVGTWQRQGSPLLFATAEEAATNEQVKDVSAGSFNNKTLLAACGHKRSVVQEMKNEGGQKATIVEHQFADSDSAYGYFSAASKGENISSTSWTSGRYDAAGSTLSFVRGRYVITVSGTGISNAELQKLASAVSKKMFETPTLPLIVDRLPSRYLKDESVQFIMAGAALKTADLPIRDTTAFAEAVDLAANEAKMVVARYAGEDSDGTMIFVIQYRTSGDAETAAERLRLAMTPTTATEPTILVDQQGSYVWGAFNKEEESVLRVMPKIRSKLPSY